MSERIEILKSAPVRGSEFAEALAGASRSELQQAIAEVSGLPRSKTRLLSLESQINVINNRIEEAPCEVSEEESLFAQTWIDHGQLVRAFFNAGFEAANYIEAERAAWDLLNEPHMRQYVGWLQEKNIRLVESLSDKQRLFVERYLIHFNRKVAIEEAGYETNSDNAKYAMASQFLARPDIKAYIRQRQKQFAHENMRSQEDVLAEISAIAFSSIFHAIDLTTDSLGRQVVGIKDPEEIPAGSRSAISKITIREIKGVREIEVAMHDKMRALGILARYYGCDTNPNEILARARAYGYKLEPEFAPDGDDDDNENEDF